MDGIERTPLIKKYDIPIAHLDFKYIKTCNNAREMEKIVHILRSGEEGWFPDLTKCAEDKLKELKPNSKHFRCEEKILTKEILEKSEWEKEKEPMDKWTNDIKIIDDKLLKSFESTEDNLIEIRPPIRHEMKKINVNSKASFNNQEKKENNTNEMSQPKLVQRIKSSEYDKWDKYDAETELLKMDLEEDRLKDEVERKNKENLKRQTQMNKKIEILNEDKTFLDKLTDVEKDNISTMHKDRGNDYYRCKEYDNAILEYTESLSYMETAAGYNNRAIAYLKLMKYNYCINDCDKCLEIEPNNIKAFLRKAQAFLGMDQRRSAYDVYIKILSIDSSNKIASDGVKDLKKQLPDLPPVHATRIIIDDDSPNTDNSYKKEISPIAEVTESDNDTYNSYKKEINTITEITDDELPTLTVINTSEPTVKDLNSNVNMVNQNPSKNNIVKETNNLELHPKQETNQIQTDEHKFDDKKIIKCFTKTQIDDQLKATEAENKKINPIQDDKKKQQKLKTSKNEIKTVLKTNKKKKDKLLDDNYGLEDLATLIIPKKFKKSSIALALEAMKNPKKDPKAIKNIADSNKKDQSNFFSGNNDILKNLKLFKK